MVLVSFNDWLSIPNKYLWRIVEENDSAGNTIGRCTAFGSDLKQVFRNLGKTLLGMHKRCHFNGDLGNLLRINTVDNSVVIIENNNSIPGWPWIRRMEADIEAFITMFNFVCRYSGPSWNNFILDLPPDVLYFNQVYSFILSNTYPTNYQGFRFMEFWIFNCPGFLSFGKQQYFFYVICDLKSRDMRAFDCYVTLRSPDPSNPLMPHPSPFVGWQNKRTQDDDGYLSKIYDYNPRFPNANPPVISTAYTTLHSIINFARNCHHHYRQRVQNKSYAPNRHCCDGNRIQIAQKIQDIYPDLIGKIHYELSAYFPRENGDINLYDHLVADEGGEREIYTWG